MSNTRIDKLAAAMQAENLEFLALNPGPSLRYLTGLDFHLMERPVVLLINSAQKMALVLPALEVTRAEHTGLPFAFFPFGDNPASWQDQFNAAVDYMQMDGQIVAIEPTRLRYLEMNFLQRAGTGIQFVSAENLLAGLRMQKDEQEIAAMRKAARIAQDALKETLALFKTGMTELEIAQELSLQLLRAGSSIELPFGPIVSAAENSADPHATPTEKKVEPGMLLLIDYGASYKGYASDITRTFAVGDVPAELQKIAEIVKQANQAGRSAGRPGVPAGSVDLAAREVIASAGYAHRFIHRTGHGLGLEAHEPPYMFAENELLLQPGMTYTVEPGIYLAGKGGVRIEDDIVVTNDGVESLTDLPRELVRIG